MQVLVFSHSVRMLDIIERLVIMTGYVYLRLDGSTKQQDRQSKVDQFNASASVFLFLISTTAGGLGLNLTAANRSATQSQSCHMPWSLLLKRDEIGSCGVWLGLLRVR